MIGGRVLDASALTAFASGRSVRAAALMWTAVQEDLVLVVPATALAAGWSALPESHHDVLTVLLHLPVTVVDDLTAGRAREVGVLPADPLDAHALLCARDRGWVLVSADAARYVHAGGVEVEQLP